MPTTTFDTLGYAKKLEAAGFTRLQAEAQASALRELIEDRIATKQDLRGMELRLKYDLTIRLGGIVVACTAILLAVLPIIIK